MRCCTVLVSLGFISIRTVIRRRFGLNQLSSARVRTLIEGRETVKVSTMLECLTDCMDATSTHRQGPEAPTAMVAKGSQELTITKKKIKSPPARELKTVDPMNDDGIWCVLDTACTATCHGKPWRPNL